MEPESRKRETICLAAGPKGLLVTVPSDVQLLPLSGEIQAGDAASIPFQEANVKQALAPLKNLAAGKRRATVVIGGLSRPAPYDIALPIVTSTLIEAGIRPSRIAFLALQQSPILGRSAIRRYGDDIVAEHELLSWSGDEPHPLLESADLTLALVPDISVDPMPDVKFDLSVCLDLGKKTKLEISAARTGVPTTLHPAPAAASDVCMAGSGGADWETTLEEALLSLHRPLEASTMVLAFFGEDGLGSAQFSRDLFSLLREAEEVVAGGGHLEPQSTAPFDPALAVAQSLGRYARIVLFSHDFLISDDGEGLSERLAELPHIKERVLLCSHEAELWKLLEAMHGKSYRLNVNPLGWRGIQ